MVYRSLNFQKTNHVMVINIIDPAGDQSKLLSLSDELASLCVEIAWDDEIRVTLLSGFAQTSFFTGKGPNDALSKVGKHAGNKPLSIAESVARLEYPVIAAIDGDAIGQGLELALACDMRIAAETAHFGLPHITKGLIPSDGGTQRLSRLIGKAKAMEMILTGEIIDAKEAHRIGLVNRVVPPGELVAVGMDMAREMASRGPIALRYAKEAIHKGMDLTLEQGLRLEADLYLLIHTTRDRTEGITSFREKKTPRFEGR
jgi:enoyl-CoA hydratase/carnithine racemase